MKKVREIMYRITCAACGGVSYCNSQLDYCPQCGERVKIHVAPPKRMSDERR